MFSFREQVDDHLAQYIRSVAVVNLK